MRQRFGAEYSSLSSATGYESLAENPLKLGQTSSVDALRLIIRITEIIGNTESKSYHGYGNGQGDIWKIGDTFLIDLLRCSVL